MFERRVLKDRAKAAFKGNYWRCVLAALVITLVAGGTGLSGPSNVQQSIELRKQLNELDQLYDYDYDAGDLQGVPDIDDFEGLEDIEDLSELDDLLDLAEPKDDPMAGMFLALFGMAFIVFIGVFALVWLVAIFLLNPFHVGTRKYFLSNSYAPGDLADLLYAFKTNYMNIVKVCFFRDLYIFLWSLLLIVPGVIKAYEYRMVNYLLTENPNMEVKEALETSRNMMYGNKWDSFVLDLSFLGWQMLAVFFTLGILGIFYVDPYVAATDAELYKVLSGKAYGFDEHSMVAGAFTQQAQNPNAYNPSAYNPNAYNPNQAPQRSDEDVYISFDMTDDTSTHD